MDRLRGLISGIDRTEFGDFGGLVSTTRINRFYFVDFVSPGMFGTPSSKERERERD